MAKIICLIREEYTRVLLENGTSGVGALQTGELGYTEETQEFSYKNRVTGAFRHIPTREKLALAAAAAASGSKGVGYFPSGGMVSTDVQAAIDELRAMVVSGGGGTVLGTGTAGKILKWLNSTTATDSILSEATSKLLFSGDTVANMYRSAAGILKTDGGFQVAGSTVLGAGALVNGAAGLTVSKSTLLLELADVGSLLAWDGSIPTDTGILNLAPTLIKNSSSTRHYSVMRIKPTLNTGGSNTTTTLDFLEIDSDNLTTTGLLSNLMKASYGGSQRLRLKSNGDFSISPDGSIFGLSIDSNGTFLRESNADAFEVVTASGSGRCLVKYQKSLGSIISPSDVSTSEILHTMYSCAFSGLSYQEGAKFQTVVDGAFTSGQNPPQRMEFYTAKANGADTLRMAIKSDGNIGFNTQTEFGGGERVLGIKDAVTVPTTNPAGGGVLYSELGALKWRGTGGTVTILAVS